MSSSPDPAGRWNLPALSVPRPRTGGRQGPDGAWVLPDLAASGRGVTPAAVLGDEQVQEAYQRGHALGLEEGAAGAQERLGGALEALRRATESLSMSREQRLRDLEANLYAIALTAARKVVLREVAADPSIVRDLLRRALGMMGTEGPIEIRLHPEDLKTIREEDAIGPEDVDSEIRWTAEPALERGGFFLEGPHRIVDGRADEALRRLYEKLCNE
jgi:flagellar assembly protein FliH